MAGNLSPNMSAASSRLTWPFPFGSAALNDDSRIGLLKKEREKIKKGHVVNQVKAHTGLHEESAHPLH